MATVQSALSSASFPPFPAYQALSMIAHYLPQLLLAWSIQWMGVLSPGPSVMLILSVATSQGRAPSLVTASGIACGTIILATATVLGLASLFAQVAELMIAVRLVGAVYLLWLAWKAFRNAALDKELVLKRTATGSPWRSALNGFTLQISNPKAIFFWIAVASVGGVGNAPLPVILIFIAGAFVNSFAGHGGYALLLSSGPIRRLYLRFRKWVEGGLGCFFLYAGYRLAMTVR
jgi:threonine/homoserine/homoserine lactone efflux protein